MKNILFLSLTVILVSHSVCTEQQSPQPDTKLSQPAPLPVGLLATTGDGAKANKQGANTIQSTTQDAQATNPGQTTTTPNQAASNPIQVETESKKTDPTKPNPTQAASPPAQNVLPDHTSDKQSESKPEADKVSTDKPVDNATKKTGDQVVPNVPASEAKPAETSTKTSNDTKPEANENSSAAVKPKNETVKPVEVPENKTVLASRAFDGASFVGGIVLTLGLLAISFVGFKYYKNLTKENYHIL